MRPRAGIGVIALTIAAFGLLYAPLAAMVTYSFLETPAAGGGLTLKWYLRALENRSVLEGLQASLVVGLSSAAIATILGTAAALALARGEFRGRSALDAVAHVSLVMPEIVMGLSLLIWFVVLRITLGSFSIILAHVSFSLAYVILTVRARLEGFDRSLEEAARDLGATPWQAFRHVTLPLIFPGVLSGALLAFTLSFDDFLVAFFTAGPGSDTLPLKLYSMIKFGVSPEINAVSTMILAVTLVLVLVFLRPFAARPAHD
ncbi:MAG TPA: ABC transporter permease [Bdellovibrionota bacterium]|nr:ABC transporter permease [Bdellovibrionota bacterium]